MQRKEFVVPFPVEPGTLDSTDSETGRSTQGESIQDELLNSLPLKLPHRSRDTSTLFFLFLGMLNDLNVAELYERPDLTIQMQRPHNGGIRTLAGDYDRAESFYLNGISRQLRRS